MGNGVSTGGITHRSNLTLYDVTDRNNVILQVPNNIYKIAKTSQNSSVNPPSRQFVHQLENAESS